jgi:hypothetical protein
LSGCVPAFLVAPDWEAIATLVTGMLAVSAAYFVGRRQLEILGRQNRLIENEQNISLLERRADCVSVMRDVHFSNVQQARLNQDVLGKFYRMVQDAELIFPESLHSEISSMVEIAADANLYHQRATDAIRDGDIDRRDKSWLQYDQAQARLDQELPNLLEKMVRLSRIDVHQAERRLKENGS